MTTRTFSTSTYDYLDTVKRKPLENMDDLLIEDNFIRLRIGDNVVYYNESVDSLRAGWVLKKETNGQVEVHFPHDKKWSKSDNHLTPIWDTTSLPELAENGVRLFFIAV